MKKLLIILVLLASIVISVVSYQFAFVNGGYSNIECGTQQWYLRILWMSFDELPIDEYGIEERWKSAHKKKCSDTWERFALGAEGSRYWPEIHLMIAKGVSINLIREKIKLSTTSELNKQDALGRTVLHWLAIHPNSKESEILSNELVERNLVKPLKDNEGLYPIDWKKNMKN